MLWIQVVLMLGFPWLSRRISRYFSGAGWLSPVVQCYALGILLGNQSLLPINEDLAHRFTEATVILGIPLLLYSTDLKAWLKQARPTLLAFGAIVFSAIVLSVGVALTYGAEHPNNWQIAGMLVGVYSGGIPNLNAVGMSLGAPETIFVYLNAADIVCGGVLLLFLTSFARRVYSWFLPAPVVAPESKEQQEARQEPWLWRDQAAAGVLTLAIAALAAAITWLFTGGLENIAVLLLLLTALSVGMSFVPRVRNWKGSFNTGDYLLLVFCVAIGSLADFRQVWSEGMEIVLWTAWVLFGALALQLLICRWLKIDHDTVIISATAALYGPVFIGQVASALRNPGLVFSGMIMGLAGYAMGNFLGYLTGIFVHLF